MTVPVEESNVRAEAGNDSYLDLLAELTRDYASAQDLAEVHIKALERIRQAMNVAGSALFMLEKDSAELVCRACIGPNDITGMRLPANTGIAGRTVQTNTVQLVNDVSRDPDFHAATDAQSGFVTQAVLYAPLSIRNKTLGAISVVNPLNTEHRFSPQSVELLQSLATAAAMAMSNADMTRELVARERVRQELVLAAEVQRRLLPDCSHLPPYIHGLSRAAREMSGDLFDVVTLEDGRLYFTVADVSGKGVNAALLMVKTTTLFRLLAKSIDQPGLLLSRLNNELCDTITGGMFVTMTAGTYDPGNGRLCLSSAGHLPSLIRNSKGPFRSLAAAMPPLGIQRTDEQQRYPEDELSLCSGELYLYSDGVTEGSLADGQHLELEGLCKLLQDMAAMPLRQRLTGVADYLDTTADHLRDDLTLLGIETPPNLQPAFPLTFRMTALPDRLALLRDLLRHALSRLQCDENEIDDIVLAVDEACQNIIRHAYCDVQEGEIDGYLSVNGRTLRIELRDDAPSAPDEACQPEPADRSADLKPGGLGKMFMHKIMDQVYFARRDDSQPHTSGNCLIMVKELSLEEAR